MFRNQAEIDKFVADNNITQYMGYKPEQIKPGMLIYRDVRGEQNLDGSYKGADGIVDDKDMIQLSKRKSNPYGMSLILGGSWKGISLNANISSSWGGYSTYAGGSYIFMNENSLDGANLPIYWKDMFVPEDVVDDAGNVVAKQNLAAKYPNMKYSMNNEASSFWKVSSFRMYVRNLSLGYTLPKEWLSKVGISSCKINLSGTNLFSFFNPYPEHYTDPLTGYGTFPALRSWTVGLNLSF